MSSSALETTCFLIRAIIQPPNIEKGRVDSYVSCCCSNKTFLIAAIVTQNIVGVIFIALGTASVFGVGTLGFVFSILGGIVLTTTSTGVLVWLAFKQSTSAKSQDSKEGKQGDAPEIPRGPTSASENPPKSKKKEDLGSIHDAAFEGREEDLRYLLQTNVDINSKDVHGWTAVHYAVMAGNCELFTEMYSRNADIKVIDSAGQTVLHKAVWVNNIPLLKKILYHTKNSLISIRDHQGRLPLHEAAIAGNSDAVNELLTRGSPINEKDNEQKTPLYLAVEAQNLDIVKILIENKAEIDNQVRSLPTSIEIKEYLDQITKS